MPPRGYPGGQVLPREEAAGEDGTREVFQDCDAVDGAADPAPFEVADIDRPVLMPPLRREGHRLRLSCPLIALCRRKARELPVQRHNPPAGAWAQVDTYLPKRRMHPPRPQRRILLQLPDGRHRLERHLPRRVQRGM